MLKQGPPPKNARAGKTAQYVIIFVIVGIVLYSLVVSLQNSLGAMGQGLGYPISQGIAGAIFSGLVGAIQAWILRDHLEGKNMPKFIGFSILGGGLGGSVAGVIMMMTTGELKFFPGLMIGAIAGAIAGTISSAGQNTFMSSVGSQTQWRMYSIISGLLIWGIGWAISWQIGYMTGTSIGSILMMITSGIALSMFLSKTSIEF